MRRSYFTKGMIDGGPFMLVVGPFGALFGLIATEAGLNIAEVMGFTVLVIAGAAQLTALQLMSDNAPVIIVILTALAVNLRAAMYSAAVVPYIGKAPLWKRAFIAYILFDQPYALSVTQYEQNPDMTLTQRVRYFMGVALPIALIWYISSYLGAVLGDRIPTNIELDIAVPISFLAVVTPLLRTLAHVAAAVTSSILVFVFAFMPYGTGLLVASFVALLVGYRVDVWLEKRKEAV